MKRNLTFLLSFFLTVALQFTVDAQGTSNDNFIFQVTTNDGTRDYYQGDCGWQYSLFGASVTTDQCSEVVWAYDITPDSVCCDTITMDLTGKWAIIRRGACNFSIKAYYAQQAGATGVIIVNHYDDPTHTPCTVTGMSAGTFGDLITVPCIFVCREVGEFIDAGIKSGTPVQGCFVLPRTYDAAGAYHYSTPITQVDTLDHIGMRMINREASMLYNVGLTATVESPSGATTTLNATIDSIAPNEALFTYFPSYLPPAEEGLFTITYATDFYTEARDTLVRHFVHTPYTFASDNLVIDPGGIGPSVDQFTTANFFIQSGAMYLTSEAGGTATYATFGLANAADVYVPNAIGAENDISVYLYDADVDDDGTWEIANDGSGSFDDLAGGLVGYAVYVMNGTEGVDSLFSVQLDDLNNPGTYAVNLKPNHPYYLSLAYDGTDAGTGVAPRFCNSLDEFYLNFPTTPLYLGQMYTGGWSGAIVIQRLEMQGFNPVGTKTLSNLDVDLQLTPNPASDNLLVNLDFGKNTPNAVVSLMNGLGKVVRSERLSNFQNGQLNFNVNNLASGTYLLSIRTNEGVAIRKVAVCH